MTGKAREIFIHVQSYLMTYINFYTSRTEKAKEE